MRTAVKHGLKRSVLIAPVLAWAAACGSPGIDGSSGSSMSRAGVPTEASGGFHGGEVVATADVGYGTVYFVEQKNEDGTTTSFVGEQVPADYATSPVRQMFFDGHTNLEVFMALLPDAEPPQSFVDGQASQALALGRADGDLLSAVYDPDMPIEKSVSWCRGLVRPASDSTYSYTYQSDTSLDEVYGSNAMAMYAGSRPATAGICNETKDAHGVAKPTTYNVTGRVRSRQGNGSYTNPGWTPLLPPGWAWVWFGLLTTHTVCDANFCTPVANTDTTYRVEGQSSINAVNNSYDLYLAKIMSQTLKVPQ